MIFTAPLGPNALPEEQRVAGHGLVFDGSGNYNLDASNTSPPAGMTGFRDANANPSCAYAFYLNLEFSATPSNWRIEMGANSFFNRATTWQRREVGRLSGTTFVAQPSNAAAAVKNDHLRLLVPQIAGNITSLRITLGSTEQSHLVSASFHRTIAVLHPPPRLQRAELAPKKRETAGIDGRAHIVLADPDPIFTARLRIDAWDTDRDLLDVNELASQRRFGLFPSGLEDRFTREQAVIYRRPDFARNMVVSNSRGLAGADGLDVAGGPAGIVLDLKESY